MRFMDGGKPFFSVGAQVQNCSSYAPNDMEWAFRAAKTAGINTLAVPFYWEQVEPEEGVFDFSQINRFLLRCRKEGLKLAVVWFGAWKDASMSYAPAWVKEDPDRFWRVRTHDGEELTVLSPHCPATYEADWKAFTRLVSFLKKSDQRHHTVCSIQVENEPGLLGAERDWRPEAEAQLRSPVPAQVVDWVRKVPLSPAYAQWQACGARETGDWPALFGDCAAEYMTAYVMACFLEGLIRGGKSIYDEVPYLINAALDIAPEWQAPGVSYIAAGPHLAGFPFYKAGAPSADMLTPDLYTAQWAEFQRTVDLYARDDNPLFISEMGPSGPGAAYLFDAVGRAHAVGVHVFGLETMVDRDGNPHPGNRETLKSLRILSHAQPLLERFGASSDVHALVQQEHQTSELVALRGGLTARVEYGKQPAAYGLFSPNDFLHVDEDPTPETGRGLLFQVSEREFYVVGEALRVYFARQRHPEGKTQQQMMTGKLLHRAIPYLRVEEGRFDADGRFVVGRLRNGDERDFGVWATEDVGVVHVVLGQR